MVLFRTIPRKPTKKSVSGRGSFGKGGSTKMFKPQAAGPDRPGNTGKDQSPAPGAQRAAGGTMPRSGGLASPAKSEHTGPPGATARSSTRNYSKGGEARPARPGECGT
jgi:hypothetical protein